MKDLNFKKIGVQEISTDEAKQIQGGWVWLAVLGVAWLAFAIGNAIGNSFDECPDCSEQ